MHTLPSRRALLFSLLLGSVCLVGLSGCSGVGTQPVAEAGAGIQGQVTRGPLSPVTQQGVTNTAPLPGVVIAILTPQGVQVAQQTSDSQGHYKVGLSPGTYQVQGLAPNGASGLPRPPAAQSVTVVAGQFVTDDVSYDTGIR